jgi:hypothetical protein
LAIRCWTAGQAPLQAQPRGTEETVALGLNLEEGPCRGGAVLIIGSATGGPVFSVAVPKTILSSSLQMLSSPWKECTFPDGTADQCADQGQTACHANLSACRWRTTEWTRTRREKSLESADPSKSGRSPLACSYLFGEKGSALWNRHTCERRIGQTLHQLLSDAAARVLNCR